MMRMEEGEIVSVGCAWCPAEVKVVFVGVVDGNQYSTCSKCERSTAIRAVRLDDGQVAFKTGKN